MVTLQCDNGYRVEWYPDEDILRIFVEGAVEPEHWMAIGRFGIEVGTATAPCSAPILDPASEEIPFQPKTPTVVLVGVRIGAASKRPVLTLDEAFALTMDGHVGTTLLTALRRGHRALHAHLGVKPLTALEAADRLAEALRKGYFTDTRSSDRYVGATGFELLSDLLDARLAEYDLTRKYT